MQKLVTLALLLVISQLAMADADTGLVKQGKYLAEMADCYACHTAEGENRTRAD
ncbi:hypothetical protein [Photobacterium sp. Hal280]|uniref:hypothetical protein n=1 Tax=Photobacterium sp. Hal280 TaxID=3035163 RepID=UPI00301C2680